MLALRLPQQRTQNSTGTAIAIDAKRVADKFFFLAIKVLCIIMAIFISLEICREFGWLDIFAKRLSPLLKILGLAPATGFIWCMAILFGLSYAGPLIVERIKKENFLPQELEALQVSVGINHALMEGQLLFIAAITVVQLLRLYHKVIPFLNQRGAQGGEK